MKSDFELRLRCYAEVIVRVGLNLQRGQRLLIAEPYELHGIAADSAPLVEAISAIAAENSTAPGQIEIIWGEPGQLREFVRHKNWRDLSQRIETNTHKIDEYVQHGDAVLFLLNSQPGLMAGIPSQQVAKARQIGAEYFGAVAQQLTHGVINWTAAPTPSATWADSVYPDLPADTRLPSLWNAVFETMRIDSHPSSSTTLAAWTNHLETLAERREELNAQRFKSVNFLGEGTDLTIDLPPEHLWRTATIRSKAGVDFVANLPTEEVFTLPHRESARGTVRISRPITFGGAVIDGIELEFSHGRVINASAKSGESLLIKLLETDPGAARLGEVALVGRDALPIGRLEKSTVPSWTKHRLFHHVLLDENAGSHIALGEGYAFCLKSPNPVALNRSLIHVDLPIEATANLRR